MIRVFLLDDHEVVRQGLIALLQAAGDIEVVGESATATEATARIPALRPDVAVLDARLSDGSGIEVCRAVRAVDPTINALILTSYDDDEALFAAIGSQVEIVLFRIVQEALSNVMRHAQAHTVQIELVRLGDRLQMTVIDDGLGFTPEQARPTSFGLVGLRERVLMLGGTLTLDSEPGEGTSLSVAIPLEQESKT